MGIFNLGEYTHAFFIQPISAVMQTRHLQGALELWFFFAI